MPRSGSPCRRRAIFGEARRRVCRIFTGWMTESSAKSRSLITEVQHPSRVLAEPKHRMTPAPDLRRQRRRRPNGGSDGHGPEAFEARGALSSGREIQISRQPDSMETYQIQQPSNRQIRRKVPVAPSPARAGVARNLRRRLRTPPGLQSASHGSRHGERRTRVTARNVSPNPEDPKPCTSSGSAN